MCLPTLCVQLGLSLQARSFFPDLWHTACHDNSFVFIHPAGHQVEEVGGFVFRSKRRAAPASPGRAKRLCSPQQHADPAPTPTSIGAPLSSIAINDQLPAAPRPATQTPSPVAARSIANVQQASQSAPAAQLDEYSNPHGAVTLASRPQHVRPTSASSHGHTQAAVHGNLPAALAPLVNPADAPVLSQDSLHFAVQPEAATLPGCLRNSSEGRHSLSDAQPPMAANGHPQQDTLQQATQSAPEQPGSAIGAGPQHQQTAAGLAFANRHAAASTNSEQPQQQHQEVTDVQNAAGQAIASKSDVGEMRPLLERMMAICEAVKALYATEPDIEGAQEADGEGPVTPSASQAVSKVCPRTRPMPFTHMLSAVIH